MRTLTGWFLGVLLVVGSAPAWAEGDHPHGAPSSTTLQGEVVDIACYVAHQGQGASHAECGKTCALSGLPVGLKVGDTVYVVVGAKHQPANAQLAPLMGRQVSVTGTVAERDGLHLIAIDSVQPVS